MIQEYGPPSEPESQQENRELHRVSPATCKSKDTLTEILETLECDRAPTLVLSLGVLVGLARSTRLLTYSP